MKKLIGWICAFAAVAAVISCGGDGGPKTFTKTGRSVQNIQRFSILSMANSGLAFITFGSGGGSTGAGTTGSNGIGGPGVASIGGFVRHFGGPDGIGPTMVRHATEVGTGGTSAGGTDGGGTGGQNFYFDDYLQLWVDTQWTDTTFTSNFFLDQSKSKPAGHITSAFTGNWTSYPQTYQSDYAFTAGTLNGAHGTYNCTQTSPLVGSMVYSNTYADGSHDQGMSSWTELGSSLQSEWDGANDSGWFKDNGSWNADTSGTYNCSSSDGWSSAWTYAADGSGSAHLEGPDPKLPADMTWTFTGNFKITYADKSVEEWTWDDLWASGDGEGTSGSTGGFVTSPAKAPAKAVMPSDSSAKAKS